MSGTEPNTRQLSVVMPAYNEEDTIAEIIARVSASPYTGELVVVDDCPPDKTAAIVCAIGDDRIRLLRQSVNQGKGAAIRRGFRESTQPFVIVQDADLEYDPADYQQVLAPLRDGNADVVFGSRFLGGGAHRVRYFWHSVGNRFLTTLSNMFTDLNLTDMETCHKAFRREVLETFELQEDRAGIELEMTAKVARGKWRIYEVGISYSGRTYAEGKKIGWRDGVRAVYCIVLYSTIGERFPVRRLGPPVRRVTRSRA
jgi:glycosyltransferase involved in cell wall biosynthesis